MLSNLLTTTTTTTITNCSTIINSTTRFEPLLPCNAGALLDITTTSTTTSSTSTSSTPTTKKPPLISDETKIIIEYIIHISLFYVTSCFGLTVNVINVIVYRKQGLKDSITLGLFALSISDLFVSGLPLETATCYLLKFVYPDSNIQFISLHYVHSSWSRRMFYSLSCLITTLLSLERCLCVILPFKVKVIFTRARTGAIILFLFIFHVFCYVPIFATHQLRWQDNPNPARNGTKILKVWFRPHRAIIENFNSTLMAIVTPTLAQVIVTCCAAIMINGLRQASKFRQSVTTTTETTTPNQQTKYPNQNLNASPPDTQEEEEEAVTVTSQSKPNQSKQGSNYKQQTRRAPTLSQRDARLVRTMVFIVAILSTCNIPYLIMTYSLLAVPDLNIARPYQNTYSLIFSITYLLSTINASLNFFTYYHTSTKYREIFHQLFCRAKTV